jgi:hypothetical protein
VLNKRYFWAEYRALTRIAPRFVLSCAGAKAGSIRNNVMQTHKRTPHHRFLPHILLCSILFTSLAMPCRAQSDDTRFAESLQRISQAGKTAKPDPDLADGSELLQQAMGLDAASASPATRQSAAQWLMLRSQKRSLRPSKNQTFLQAANAQADLLRAWQLLAAPLAPGQARLRAQLRLSLALDLRDPGKMQSAYPELANLPELNQDELALCLMAAAHLGQWADVNRHASAFVTKGGELKTFHERADRDLTIFDYESLLAVVQAAQPALAAQPARSGVLPGVASYDMYQRRARVISISGSNTNLVRQLQKISPADWVEKPLTQFALMQVGAAAHWVESVTHPPVSGLLGPDRLLLKGYRIAPNSNQSQSWDMKLQPGKAGHWTGNNRVIFYKKNGGANAPAEAEMVFEEEWDMLPSQPGQPTLPVPAGSPAAPAQPVPPAAPAPTHTAGPAS